nr:nucleoside monophosphate kinase [Ardenticatena sp.]
MRRHIVLIGPPGSGKGTQARRLQACLGHHIIGAGDLLRREMEARTPMGQAIARYVEAGHLAPLVLLMRLVEQEIRTLLPERGIIFDGIPRSLSQAKALDEMLHRYGRRLDTAIHLRVPDHVVQQRLLARGRPDDTPDIIRERLRIYHTRRSELLDYYHRQGILVEVDGNGDTPPDGVFQRIRAALHLTCRKE